MHSVFICAICAFVPSFLLCVGRVLQVVLQRSVPCSASPPEVGRHPGSDARECRPSLLHGVGGGSFESRLDRLELVFNADSRKLLNESREFVLHGSAELLGVRARSSPSGWGALRYVHLRLLLDVKHEWAMCRGRERWDER